MNEMTLNGNILQLANEIMISLYECKNLGDKLFMVEAGLMDQFDMLLLQELLGAIEKTRILIAELERQKECSDSMG